MRVLFYGGCHGAAFRRAFERYGKNVESVDHLTNFRLIREQLPFPYETLKNFDVVCFNPILNKEAYNTVHLEEYCRMNGIRYFKYPWVQWEGYYPGFKRSPPSWYAGWWSTSLDALADQSRSFDHFAAQVIEGDGLREEALRHLDTTTAFLRKLESHADLKIADYVLDNFRKKRLFLTLDHATMELYKFMTGEIATAIGVRLDPSFYNTTVELQAGLQLPILPSIARALDLEFTAGDFENKFLFGKAVIPLIDYLRLHYHRSNVRYATAASATRIHIGRAEFPEASRQVSVKEGTRLLVINAEDRTPGVHRSFHVVADCHGVVPNMPTGGLGKFFTRHWKFAFKGKLLGDGEERVALSLPPRETDIAA